MEDSNGNGDKPKKGSYCVKVDEKDRKRLEKMSSAMGLSIPALFRKSLLGRNDLEAPAFSPEDAHALKVAINRLGNNVNQIAVKVNAEGRIGWNQSFNSFLREYSDIRLMLLRKCGHN